MNTGDRLDLERHAGDALLAFTGIEQSPTVAVLDGKLRHLAKLRASQINGCAHCVAMHSDEARRDGEWPERLDQLVVWREVGLYTAAERAALAWTEALTRLNDLRTLPLLHSELTRHYSEKEIGALTVVNAMINVWNRLQIASAGGGRNDGTAGHAG